MFVVNVQVAIDEGVTHATTPLCAVHTVYNSMNGKVCFTFCQQIICNWLYSTVEQHDALCCGGFIHLHDASGTVPKSDLCHKE